MDTLIVPDNIEWKKDTRVMYWGIGDDVDGIYMQRRKFDWNVSPAKRTLRSSD